MRQAQSRAHGGTRATADPTGSLEERITATLIALAGLPSVSGQEGAVRAYVRTRLERLGLAPLEDAAGTLIARMPASDPARDREPPLLINAHLDRVPPGRAHTPVLADGILRSDGATNLGADDSAGIAIMLHTVEGLRARGLPHSPLLLLFTVGEEVGLVGAKAFDPTPWGAREGIVFDNAGDPGVVVTRAATYIAFDVVLRGSAGHPGKGLAGTASAIEMFRRAEYPFGELDDDATRVSIGRIEGGTARNAVPSELRAQGEVRTLLDAAGRAELLRRIERAFVAAAEELGGSAAVSFDPHCDAYTVAEDEPLLRAYAATLASRGQALRTTTTFIGSDASALRASARVFTVSTGAMDEHTSAEWIALAPLAELTETAVALLSSYQAEEGG
jgi:tripeptide aminopeptidase